MSFDLPGVEPNSNFEKLFKTVGFITVQWGINEQHLDLVVADIFHHFEGHSLLNSRPINLTQKTKLLRDCFAEFAELGLFRAECDVLLTRFTEAGKRRNEIVHGAIAELSSKGDVFMFLKIDVIPKEHHSIRFISLSGAEWPIFREELLALGRESLSLAQRVSSTLNRGDLIPDNHVGLL